MTPEERRRQLFYAELEAGMYDATIELVAPQYRLLHDTIVQLLIYHFKEAEGAPVDPAAGVTEQSPLSPAGWILDVGSGTGAESISILQQFPGINVVAIDIAQPMHALLRTNLERKMPGVRFEARVKTQTADIVEYVRGTGKDLRAHLPHDEECQGYRAIISAFAIHSLEDEEKKQVYQCLYDALEPGGILINGDLFTYQAPNLARWAHEFDMDWIERQFDKPEPQFMASRAVHAAKRAELKERWKAHYLTSNRLSPIEDACHALQQPTVEQGVEGQAQMLLAAGFREASCPFRFWQAGILWGKK